MKSPLKTLAAAVGLALLSSGAHAALVTGGQTTDDSNLFLLAFDPASTHTFVADLGVTYTTLNSHSGAGDNHWFTSVNLGSLVTPGTGPGQFSFGDGVKWTLAAGRTATTGFTSANNGVFATFNANVSPAGAYILPTTSGGLTTLNNFRGVVTGKANLLNTNAGAGGTPGIDHFASASTSDHGSYEFDGTGKTQSYGGGVAAWGDNANNKSPGSSTLAGTIGTDSYLEFVHWYRGSDGKAHSELQPGVWQLSSTGVLSYGAIPAAPVPVPGAAWLLGSAVLGLTARRRQSN